MSIDIFGGERMGMSVTGSGMSITAKSETFDILSEKNIIVIDVEAEYRELSNSNTKNDKSKTRVCKICGCTDTCACDDGCYWVEPNLCSRCLYNEIVKQNHFEQFSDTQEYTLIFSLDYEGYDFEVFLPAYFSNLEQAEVFARYSQTSFVFTADGIHVVFSELNITVSILSEEKKKYEIKVISDEKKKSMGKPLSPNDIEELKREGNLEDVIFSSNYIVGQEDLVELDISLSECFFLLKEKYSPSSFGSNEYYSLDCLAYGVIWD